MKKFSVLITLFLLAAFVLTACGGANNADNNLNGNNAGELDTTPGVGTGMDLTGTPDAGAGVGDTVATPTLVVEDEVEATATPAAGGAVASATPAAGEVVGTGTPAAGTPGAAVPVTGDDDDLAECVPNRLDNLFEYDVVDDAGNVLGDVDAIIVNRAAQAASMSDGANNGGANAGTGSTGAAATGTPAANETPAAGMTGDDGAVFQAGPAPVVAYVIVDMDDAGNLGDKDVIVPFSAFEFTGSEDNDDPVQATPAATTAAGAVNNEVAGGCVLTFAGGADALNNAPNVDNDAWDNLDMEAEGWDEDFRTYWTGEGFEVETVDAETGEALANPVVLDGFDDIDVENANGDDLGEIEDFIIDPETGRFEYAVLATGGFLGIGERHVPVPTNVLMWGDYDDDADDFGEVVINVPDEAFENAPVIEDWNDLDFTVDGWDTEYSTFWADYSVTNP